MIFSRWINAALGTALFLFTGCAGWEGRVPSAYGIRIEGPPWGMPASGSDAVLRGFWEGSRTGQFPPGGTFRWSRDGALLPHAKDSSLLVPAAAPGHGGVYVLEAAWPGGGAVSRPYILEPVDALRIVTRLEDEGPGTLREAMEALATRGGTGGIAFRIHEGLGSVIRLRSPLPPIQGGLCILGPGEEVLTVSGEGVARPFLLLDGRLVLAGFSISGGLAKGGDAPGGGGAGPGMGGGLFIQNGRVLLRNMTFAGNAARGGTSLHGTDGEGGGGAGFDTDSPSRGGGGADGGALEGQGGAGHLDGVATTDGGGDPGLGDGAGGGAARGGSLETPLATWAGNLSGGDGSGFAGGGGFSVGPAGGGGDGSFGAGGGGSGGLVLGVGLPGVAAGQGGFFAGDGGLGDGVFGGRGGGGAGLGGAIYLRSGRLELSGCTFRDNRARGGEGAERGLGKGGALFIEATADDQGFPAVDPASLRQQAFSGNRAQDLLEAPDYDNDDFYLAQVPLEGMKAGDPLRVAYRLYQISLKMGLPARPSP